MDSTMNSVQSTVNEGKTGKYERKISNKGEKLRSDSVSSDMVVTTGDAGMALASTRKENAGSTESEGTKDWSYPVISTTGANTHLLQHTTSNTHVTRSRQCDQPKKFSQQQQRSKEEGNDDTGGQQTFPGEGKHNRRGRMEGVRVPDGGWGWLVAMACFFITMLFLSLGQCFGVLFSGYLLELGTSSAITGWIYNIMWLIWHLIGPLLRPLTKEFGWRRIGYLGVFLVSSSIIMSAFSPSAEFLFFSYSLITVFPFLTSITWLAVTMAVFGVGIGASVTLKSLIIIQFMGIENLPSTYGVSSLLTGIGFPIFGPLSGFVRDVTGSYAISIWVLAAMIFLCFILWLFMPAAVAYDNKRSQKERKQEPSDA